jgi:ketosteroid isomerase-like protein
MAEDAAKVAAAYFDAWKAKDFGALRSLLADDVEYQGPLAQTDGADACLRALEGASALTTDLVIQKTFVADADVLTWFALHTEIAPVTPVANWMSVRNGKIARIRAIYDPRELIREASAAGE